MGNVAEWIKVVAAAIGAGLAWIFGPWDALLAVLVGLVVMDYLMGVIGAAINKELDSRVGFKGLWRKVVIFLMVGLGVMLDRVIPTDGIIRAAVCTFYIANEGLSILENAGKVGIPMPAKLRAVLEQLKEDSEKAE